MLRLSTAQGMRIFQSDQFSAQYGGAEANVAISLANFGHEVAFASKVPQNALGDAVEKHLATFGVDTTLLLRGGQRLGTYYVETGVGQRASKVTYDRFGSSFATMDITEWETDELFKDVTIFHITGITPALSKLWQTQLNVLIQAAKQAGAKVSFDMNYRGNLWSQQEASEVLQTILPYVDYCSAGELDARYLLNIATQDSLADYYESIHQLFPNIKVFYSTKREVYSASENELMGTIWTEATGYLESKPHKITAIVDRVGGGDAFSAGVLHGILQEMPYQEVIEFATAASVLKHTVYGDCNVFSQADVEQFLTSATGAISR